MADVFDEMRSERKILMCIRSALVEKYITLDITNIDINNQESHKEYDQEIQFAIQDKIKYR